MEYFKMGEQELTSCGAIYTAPEIFNQPETWKSTFERFSAEKEEIRSFLDMALKNVEKILLTGAGTSAFIGNSLEGSFQRHTGITSVSIPTTHLVTHPLDYFQKNQPVLLVSFARSGNSPESVATVKLADKICDSCYHLVITCDPDGNLARFRTEKQKYTFVLPPESNDKGLAMTSSYTSMLLSGLLCARMNETDLLKDQVGLLIDYGKRIIHEYSDKLKNIASLNFTRAVFLGSGPLFGTSSESHLKLQELTDGQIICKNDTFLAFRHGPKAVIDEQTLVVFLFSNKESVQRYERDFVSSMKKGKKAMKLIGVCESRVEGINLDLEIRLSPSASAIEEEFLAICSVLPAQMLGLFKSLELGLKPDNPSLSGAISRVVEGVVIYNV